MKYVKKSIAAGAMISIGCIAKISNENNFVGAFLFSVGLFTICYFDMYLYTGKIGYVFSEHGLQIKAYLMIWMGNILGCLFVTLPYRLFVDDRQNVINKLMNSKLAQSGSARAVLAFLCGMLMCVAVENFRKNKSEFVKIYGIVMCVTVFVISGFEHSIADVCYSIFYVKTLDDIVSVAIYITDIAVWNSIGAIVMRVISCGEIKEKKYEFSGG